jgi:polar amino acid transport system substrate-binding protein
VPEPRTPWAIAVIAAVLTGVGAALITNVYFGRNEAAVKQETAYDYIIKTTTIRAAYVNYPPGTIVDPKADEVSGIFPDLLRRIGKDTSLDVKFTEEVGYANMIQGLESNRYDIVGGVWANPNRGKIATVSAPAYYSGIGVWVRAGETRFSSQMNWESINSSDVRVGAIDGSTPLTVAQEQFPKANLVTYPNLTTEPQLFLDLVQNKIDVFFAEPSQGILFAKANPGKIQNIAVDHPLRIFADVFLMKSGEFQLKNLVDTALFDLESRGIVDQLIGKYQPAPGAFYNVAAPYMSGEGSAK